MGRFHAQRQVDGPPRLGSTTARETYGLGRGALHHQSVRAHPENLQLSVETTADRQTGPQ